MKFDFSDSAVKISFDSPEEHQDFRDFSEEDKEDYLVEYLGFLHRPWFLTSGDAVNIGLTSAPCIVELDPIESGAPLEGSAVYWFPNYAAESFLETLADTGTVIFPCAAPGEHP